MLKPNYHHKIKASNYVIGYGFGNGYYDSLKTRGVFELLINGFNFRFIPEYNTSFYSFPPIDQQLRRIIDSEGEFRSCNEFRAYSFLNADVVFYAADSHLGKGPMNLEFRIHENEVDHTLLCFIAEETYRTLRFEVQRSFPYVFASGRHHKRRSDLLKTKSVAFIDEQLSALKDILPEELKSSLLG